LSLSEGRKEEEHLGKEEMAFSSLSTLAHKNQGKMGFTSSHDGVLQRYGGTRCPESQQHSRNVPTVGKAGGWGRRAPKGRNFYSTIVDS